MSHHDSRRAQARFGHASGYLTNSWLVALTSCIEYTILRLMTKPTFEAWYTVGHWMTRSARKARELQAEHGGKIRRHVSVNGKVESEVIS